MLYINPKQYCINPNDTRLSRMTTQPTDNTLPRPITCLLPAMSQREEVVLREPGFIVRLESCGRPRIMQRHERHGDMSMTLFVYFSLGNILLLDRIHVNNYY